MKRFIAFAGSCYYPSGGMQDCIGSFDDVDTAVDACKGFVEAEGHYRYWWHVWDSESMAVVGDDTDSDFANYVVVFEVTKE